jgi:hypothetical protein
MRSIAFFSVGFDVVNACIFAWGECVCCLCGVCVCFEMCVFWGTQLWAVPIYAALMTAIYWAMPTDAAYPNIIAYADCGANCAGPSVANLVLFYRGEPAVFKQPGIDDSGWTVTYGGPYDSERILSWDGWNLTLNTCPFQMPSPPATRTKLLNVPPRYSWGQVVITGTGSDAFRGGA